MSDPVRIRQFPVIDQLAEDDLQKIQHYLSVQNHAPGTLVVAQDQVDADFHIVVSGELDVIVADDQPVRVATLSRGDFFGEMSCLTGAPVSATVQARQAVQTLSMPKEGLLQLMRGSEPFRNHMLDSLVRRITESNGRVLQEHQRNTVVLQQLQQERQSRFRELLGDSESMQALRAWIERHAAATSPLLLVGEAGTGKSHVAWALHRLSGRGQAPIITLDAATFSMDDWTTHVRAARGGTLLLERVDDLPDTILRPVLQDVPPDTRLVLTTTKARDLGIDTHILPALREHAEDIPDLVAAFIGEADYPEPEAMVARDAMNLLTQFPFLAGNVQELRRVVHNALVLSNGHVVRIRHLRFGSARQPGSRPRIGLALGSGSVRGAAHVGVIKALEAQGVPIDVVAGTSVGAFIGALYVGGQTVADFERVLPTVKWRQLVQPVLPSRGFVKNQRMTRFVEKYIGPVEFENLPIPFAAVASDAVTGEAHILKSGKVSAAICGSTAIPGVMHPVDLDGKWLLDGAVAHPVPVALAKSLGADIVIAVNLGTPTVMKKAPRHFVGTILNTIDIMSERMTQEELQLADFVLNPTLETNQLTFKESAAYIESGRLETLKIIDALKEKIDTLQTP